MLEMTKAWSSIFPELALRSRKPRSRGVTMLLDKCQGPTATTDLIAIAGDYIDFWKLSYGTSALLEEDFLRRKIETIREHDIIVHPGGTLAEYAIMRGVCRDYVRHCQALGFTGIEISDGTIDLSPSARRDAIRYALDIGLNVISEVGKKDPNEQPSPEQLAEQAIADFETGVSWVIVDARESGRGIGVFNEDGSVREDSVDIMADMLKDHLDHMIWETPLKKQQEYFILRFGPHIGLGNIQPRDVLALESMRTGIRFETFRALAEKLLKEAQQAQADSNDG
jgi:phosphosulfolactate synthase